MVRHEVSWVHLWRTTCPLSSPVIKWEERMHDSHWLLQGHLIAPVTLIYFNQPASLPKKTHPAEPPLADQGVRFVGGFFYVYCAGIIALCRWHGVCQSDQRSAISGIAPRLVEPNRWSLFTAHPHIWPQRPKLVAKPGKFGHSPPLSFPIAQSEQPFFTLPARDDDRLDGAWFLAKPGLFLAKP